MANTPWLTTDALVESIKRKISVPISQVTFEPTDLHAFLNDEMFSSQVPSVLLYHEEYFVTKVNIPVENNKTRYAIPDRAIGMRLRDIFWKDQNNNLYEMTRINPDDKAWFQRDFHSGNPYPYYLEGNYIVLPSNNVSNATGSFQISFFIRPNQLVANENAAIIQNFANTITINNLLILPGDTITINDEVFTAVLAFPVLNEFEIGVNATATALNLAGAINTNGIVSASNNAAVVTLSYTEVSTSISTSNELAFVIPDTIGIFFDQIPSNITNGTVIDFLQTRPGHQILSYDVEVPSSGVSGTSIFGFTTDQVPDTVSVGDYACLANTAIIPQLPPDLHNLLAERAAARVLASLGDTEALQLSQAKIQEMEKNQGSLIDARVDGDPQKVLARHSLLRYGKRAIIRRI